MNYCQLLNICSLPYKMSQSTFRTSETQPSESKRAEPTPWPSNFIKKERLNKKNLLAFCCGFSVKFFSFEDKLKAQPLPYSEFLAAPLFGIFFLVMGQS